MILACRYLKNCHVERELDFLCVILEGKLGSKDGNSKRVDSLIGENLALYKQNELPCKGVSYPFLEVFKQRLCTFYKGCGGAVRTFVIGLSDLLVF